MKNINQVKITFYQIKIHKYFSTNRLWWIYSLTYQHARAEVPILIPSGHSSELIREISTLSVLLTLDRFLWLKEKHFTIIQVSVVAEEVCTCVCWPRMRLERVLRHRPALKVVLDCLIGQYTPLIQFSVWNAGWLKGRKSEGAMLVNTLSSS